MQKFLVFFALLSLADGRLQAPFTGSLRDEIFVDIVFNASIGTSDQNVQIELESKELTMFQIALYVLDKNTYKRGFDSSKSSTFKKVGDISSKFGSAVNGTDTVKIGSSSVNTKPLEVVSKDVYKELRYDGKMSVDRYDDRRYRGVENKECKSQNNDCTTFVQSVVRDFKDQVLVLAFDKFDGDLKKNFTGQLVLGDKPSDICSSDWAFLPEISPRGYAYPIQWTFNVGSVSIGKYSWNNPRGFAYFDLADPRVYLPSQIFSSVIKALGGTGSTDVKCDSTIDIVLNLGGKELAIKPSVYINKVKDGQCVFNGFPATTVDYFQFPASMLSEYCFAFDYKNFGVGFAKRV